MKYKRTVNALIDKISLAISFENIVLNGVEHDNFWSK